MTVRTGYFILLYIENMGFLERIVLQQYGCNLRVSKDTPRLYFVFHYGVIIDRREWLLGGLAVISILTGCVKTPSKFPTPSDQTTTETQTRDTSSTTASCSTTTENPGVPETQSSLQSKNTPTTVVQAYYEALYAGDAKTANQLLHEDSPISEHASDSLSHLKNSQYRLTDIHTNQTHARHRTVHFTVVLVTPDGETQRRETQIQVKRFCGRWQIWQ